MITKKQIKHIEELGYKVVVKDKHLILTPKNCNIITEVPIRLICEFGYTFNSVSTDRNYKVRGIFISK